MPYLAPDIVIREWRETKFLKKKSTDVYQYPNYKIYFIADKQVHAVCRGIGASYIRVVVSVTLTGCIKINLSGTPPHEHQTHGSSMCSRLDWAMQSGHQTLPHIFKVQPRALTDATEEDCSFMYEETPNILRETHQRNWVAIRIIPEPHQKTQKHRKYNIVLRRGISRK